MRLRTLLLLLSLFILAPRAALAQTSSSFSANLSLGATYYCIVSRCDEGTTVGATVAASLTRYVAVEAGVRRHFCTDCGTFLIMESALLLQYDVGRITPFAAVGISRSSDNEFMGTEVGALGSVGSFVRLGSTWGGRVELRGRRIGKGDAMGELSIGLTRRF